MRVMFSFDQAATPFLREREVDVMREMTFDQYRF